MGAFPCFLLTLPPRPLPQSPSTIANHNSINEPEDDATLADCSWGADGTNRRDEKDVHNALVVQAHPNTLKQSPFRV